MESYLPDLKKRKELEMKKKSEPTKEYLLEQRMKRLYQQSLDKKVIHFSEKEGMEQITKHLTESFKDYKDPTAGMGEGAKILFHQLLAAEAQNFLNKS
tara:strand:+ start:259 stop:552 length:294 start_codon:yes stop_codon:yes gene_type:complete